MRSLLFLRATAAEEDLLTADLWEHHTAGITEEPQGLRAFFPSDAMLDELIRRYGHLLIESREEIPTDWQQVSREGWDPVLAGTQFFIVPPWLSDREPPPGRHKLIIDTGMAFGSGRHESTQLMIEAFEKHLRPAHTLVDIGCGSGILCAVAARLGVTRLFGCDTNPDFAERARLHTGAPLFLGSAPAIRDRIADVVAVNISAAVIDELAHEIRRIARPGALLLLAGFIEANPPRKFEPREVLQQNEWQCWVCLNSL
jgi:ribosomal protein L11 methyltransferase